MKFKKFWIILIITIVPAYIFSQTPDIDKIEPPNWWTGMKLNKVQLMVYGENLSDVAAEIDGIEIVNVFKTENPSYLFIDVNIAEDTDVGEHKLILSNESGKTEHPFPIFDRENDKKRFQGFSQEDVIYLLMPDRFVNADPSNDKIQGFNDKFEGNPTQERHGGDIQGVINKLDYLKDLGITALWLNPVVENNTDRSYHGYAATDFYTVDARLGTNEDYKRMVDELHKRDMKIILDHVANHISAHHPWVEDPPTNTWINGKVGNHLPAMHHKMVFTDPHHDPATVKWVTEGWFVDYMPDLNQKDPFVANYIIQNTIWWMEYANIDGIREDTYPYADQLFMYEWAKVVLEEYPTINIVGEVWSGEPAFLAGYQQGDKFDRGFDTYLPSITDFGIRDTYVEFLQGRNIMNIYTTFAKDFLYNDPYNLVTFIDNHDVARTMFIANQNTAQAKLAYVMLLTTRGIPQIFYGSEIGMVGTNDHGTLRMPFPGGFPDDKRDAFTEEGRTKYENDIFNFLKKLISLRKEHSGLATGKFTHFPPHNNVYFYFKENEDEKILVIINNNLSENGVNLSREMGREFIYKSATDLWTNEKVNFGNDTFVPMEGKGFKILLLD